MKFRFASVSDFDRIFELLELSFPPTEVRNIEGQRSLFEAKQYRVLMDEDNNSMIAYWDFEDFIFGEHFAVDPTKRGGGHGAKMFKSFLNRFDIPVILGVEPPQNEISTRRIAFYERMGCVLNDFPYIQPNLRQEEKPIELKIMSFPKRITEDEFKTYKHTLHKFVYKIKN